MNRTVFQVILLFFLASICLSGFLMARHILQLPFRPANDALHQKKSALTLDCLIPSGAYLDDKITIGEVIKIRTSKVTPFYERMLQLFSDLIPAKFRYLADLLLFFFWSFSFMTFFRVFTFMGYGRALRGSLLLGGCIYYFTPDFSPGRIDDVCFVGFPIIIILLRVYILRRKTKGHISKA
ncbi:MAG: hypothetical protein ABIF87_11920 [Pseudomonadota bacterium]